MLSATDGEGHGPGYLVDSTVIYELPKCAVYEVDINTKIKIPIAWGKLRLVERPNVGFVIGVGDPIENVPFTYQLPGVFVSISADVMNTAGVKENTFVSIVIEELSNSVDYMDELVKRLREHGCAIQEPRYESTSENIGWGFRAAGDGISSGIRGLGSLASQGIEKLGDVHRNNMEAAKAGEETKISKENLERMEAARDVTKTAVFAAGTVITAFGAALGTGVKMVANEFQKDDEGKQYDPHKEKTNKQKTFNVGKSAVVATIKVFSSMGDAESQVVKTSVNEGARSIGHKYGEDAGQAASESAHIVGNVMDVRNCLSVTNVAKGTAISAAKAKVPGKDGENKPREYLHPTTSGNSVDSSDSRANTNDVSRVDRQESIREMQNVHSNAVVEL